MEIGLPNVAIALNWIRPVSEQLRYSRAHAMLGFYGRGENTYEHTDNIVRDPADCVDDRVHRHARGQRFDSHPYWYLRSFPWCCTS
jgi:hypothetical protein